MSGFKGKVIFAKNTKYNFISCVMANKDGVMGLPADEYIEVGSCEVDVEFWLDTREKEIEHMEAEIKKREIEHHVWLETMSGKIQSLRCIEHTETAE